MKVKKAKKCSQIPCKIMEVCKDLFSADSALLLVIIMGVLRHGTNQ